MQSSAAIGAKCDRDRLSLKYAEEREHPVLEDLPFMGKCKGK
ncbi:MULTISPECIES: hypothetical protein [unclassified Nostoc]|nr:MULTISPECIES: hypothetical protein [unclassified Nostoc]MDZ8122892.1 hypothetical protein [Nostoc sp. CmiVER01]MDZ8224093.1 hypothetical protein [Nostoc sp. ChiVER01]